MREAAGVSPRAGVEVLGGEEIARVLRAYRDRLGTRDLSNALRAGATVLQVGAIRRAPFRTGLLRKSIEVWRRSHRGHAVYLIGTNEDAFYAHMVEFGTGSYAAGDTRQAIDRRYPGREFTKTVRKKHVETPAQPFLGPAADEDKDLVVAAIHGYLLRSLQRGPVARKRTRRAG